MMIVLDVVHPPAVSTSLGFAVRAGADRHLVLLAMTFGLVVVLVALQRASLRLLALLDRPADGRGA